MYLINFWILAKEISKQNVESASVWLCVIKQEDTGELKEELLQFAIRI